MNWKEYFDHTDPVEKHNREIDYQAFRMRMMEEFQLRRSMHVSDLSEKELKDIANSRMPPEFDHLDDDIDK
jgi:hypothetical protein